jgi:hypothetical protein
LLSYKKISDFVEEEFQPKTFYGSAPYPNKLIGSLSPPFQWTELLESETLVFTGTKKTGNQNQYQSIFVQAQFQEVKVGFLETDCTRILTSTKRTSW